MSLITAIVLTDASREVGLGNFTRAKILVDSLIAHGVVVNFLVIGDPWLGLTTEQHYPPFQFVPNKPNAIRDQIVKMLANKRFSIGLIDLSSQGRNLGVQFEIIAMNLRRNVNVFGSVEGGTGFDHFFDLILHPFFSKPTYPIISTAELIFGWDCFLLQKSRGATALADSRSEILILTGGSDPTDLNLYLPAMLNQTLIQGTKVNWVVGPMSKKPNIKSLNNIDMRLTIAPRDLGDCFKNSSVVWATYGLCFFESILHRKATVLFSPYGLRDRKEMNEIRKLDIAKVTYSVESSLSRLNALIANRKEVERLFLRCDGLFPDVTGQRFVELLLEKVAL